MGAVMIRCPRTGRAVSTAIETEPAVFSRLPEVAGRMRCPDCGQEHFCLHCLVKRLEQLVVPKLQGELFWVECGRRLLFCNTLQRHDVEKREEPAQAGPKDNRD